MFWENKKKTDCSKAPRYKRDRRSLAENRTLKQSACMYRRPQSSWQGKCSRQRLNWQNVQAFFQALGRLKRPLYASFVLGSPDNHRPAALSRKTAENEPGKLAPGADLWHKKLAQLYDFCLAPEREPRAPGHFLLVLSSSCSYSCPPSCVGFFVSWLSVWVSSAA